MKSIKKVLLLVLCLLVLVGCGGNASENETSSNNSNSTPSGENTKYGGVLNFVSGKKDDHMDIYAPSASVGTHYWARYVYEGALALGNDGLLYPLVCEYDYDKENYSWFKLWVREGVTFHDGTPVTIEDVKASYDRSIKRDLYEHVVSEDITNGVWTLNYDEVGCVGYMYWYGYNDPQYGIMPKWICDKFNVADNQIITDPEYVIGTGCYKIIPDEYINQEVVALERYDGYVPCTEGPDDGSAAAPRYAYLDKINILVNSDANNSLMHFMSGEYDVISATADIYKSSLQPLGYSMYIDESGRTASDQATCIFNMHDNSTSIVKNDVNLRRAIMAAIDFKEAAYAEYSDWYFDQHSPLYLDGYSTEAYDVQDFVGEDDIELCKEYLAKSNYNGEDLVLRYPSTAGGAMIRVIVQNLQDAGIKCHSEATDSSVYVSDYRDGTAGWDMYLLFAAGSVSTPQNIPVNNYVCWTSNKEAGLLREELFKYPAGTQESIDAWEAWSKLSAEEVNCFCICRSKGDRFVQQPGLHPNYTGYQNYRNAYWDNPSEHN